MAAGSPHKKPRLSEGDDDDAKDEQQEQAGPATPGHDGGVDLVKHWNVSDDDITRAHDLWQEAVARGVFASDTAPNVHEAALFMVAKGVAPDYDDEKLRFLLPDSETTKLALKNERAAKRERLLHLLKASLRAKHTFLP